MNFYVELTVASEKDDQMSETMIHHRNLLYPHLFKNTCLYVWRTKWTKPPTQTSPNQNIVIKAFEPRFKALIWSSNVKPRFNSGAVDLEAFDLEAVGLEASDIAFAASNQDYIGHESNAYLDYRASTQSPLLKICL